MNDDCDDHTKHDSRYIVVAGDQFDSFPPDLLVHEGVNISQAGGQQLHHAALGGLPEQPWQVEAPSLEDEDKDHPLVELVVSPALAVTVHVILAQSGVGVVNTLGPVEPENVVNITMRERERERECPYLSLTL